MKNRYTPTLVGLYINYIVHGMGVIILSQNQNILAEEWGTDIAGVGAVISMLGIGHFFGNFITGVLSDKYGRKVTVIGGMFSYILFFAGILFSPNVTIASIFGIIAGVANSFLDSGTYPALSEAVPNKAGSANVLIKAFIQIGQFTLPIIIGALIANNAWYGWSFVVPIVVLVLNTILIFSVKFPDEHAREQGSEVDTIQAVQFKEQPSLKREGIALLIYGFTAQTTFYVISQYINQYGMYVAGMENTDANLLLSYYSIGSIACVFITAILATRIRSVNLMLVYTISAFLSLLMMYIWPTPTVLRIGSVLIGFFAAGGVLQLGLTVMEEFFPEKKGTVTSLYFALGSVASFLVPIICSNLAVRGGEVTASNVHDIMLFDVAVTAVGVMVAIYVFYRYRKTVDFSAESN